jgi:hypothetical protein
MDLRPYANAEGPRLQYYQLPPEQPSPSAYAGEADWIEGAKVQDTLSAGMGCDGHHTRPSRRFAKNRVDRAPPRPVRVFLPSATGCRMALPVAKTTRSRLRGISPPPVGRRFPTIQLMQREGVGSLGVCQRRLPRRLEGSRRPNGYAPARYERHPHSSHLGRACCRPRVSLRPSGNWPKTDCARHRVIVTLVQPP